MTQKLHPPPEDNYEPTLGDRVRLVQKAELKRASIVSPNAYYLTRAPESVAKRTRKNGPREISSRRPVPVGRERCLGIDSGESRNERSVKRGFDPRFEEHCGELREEHVERNYAFVVGLRERRKKMLEDRVRKKQGDEEVERELRAMDEEEHRRKGILRRRKILADLRQEEKEAVKRGKKPYFLKEKDIRKLEMKEKFKELKEVGGVKKYIEKRRRRLAGKDRKLLPSRRDQHGS
eukprot:GFKZ01008530.1.p1 GENE.GFKZ01008530.1~~GFKZ01008530.1.p1  ORF type:complete len:235 (-),score=53.05 GFKZ01008530.1:1993-2697(-)